MDINELIAIVKKKIEHQAKVENITIEDKTFLHKNHSGYKEGKYHLKIFIKSEELKKLTKIDSNKVIYKILHDELRKFIHSLQILIS
tara:strand:+ start:474 stop:734 length:261 start_codon:yes stop_codon:yes gene_type:complete